MQGRELDRDALHRLLWERRTGHRTQLVEIHQGEYARELRVNNSTMSTAISELCTAGKLRKLRAKRNNVGVYVVRDPELFK